MAKEKISDNLIMTGEDVLIALVRKEKRISLNKAADKLGVSLEVAEDWATSNNEAGGILQIDVLKGRKTLALRKKPLLQLSHIRRSKVL